MEAAMTLRSLMGLVKPDGGRLTEGSFACGRGNGGSEGAAVLPHHRADVGAVDLAVAERLAQRQRRRDGRRVAVLEALRGDAGRRERLVLRGQAAARGDDVLAGRGHEGEVGDLVDVVEQPLQARPVAAVELYRPR